MRAVAHEEDQVRVLYLDESLRVAPITFLTPGGSQFRNSPRFRGVMGGVATALQYDDDALIWINDSSRINGMSRNERATDYVFSDSDAARQGRALELHPGTEFFNGPVVMTGIRDSDVPQRLIDYFGAEEFTDWL